jgi:hypothetical protein
MSILQNKTAQPYRYTNPFGHASIKQNNVIKRKLVKGLITNINWRRRFITEVSFGSISSFQMEQQTLRGHIHLHASDCNKPALSRYGRPITLSGNLHEQMQVAHF